MANSMDGRGIGAAMAGTAGPGLVVIEDLLVGLFGIAGIYTP